MRHDDQRNGGGYDPAAGLVLRPRAAASPSPRLRDPRLWAGLATLLVHVLGTAWLFRHGVARPPAPGERMETPALRVEWIELTAPPAPPVPLAPGPAATRPRVDVRAAVATSATAPRAEAAHAQDNTPVHAPEGGRSLLGQIGAGASAVVGAVELPKRDPLEPGFRLPGRGEAFVEGFHVRAEVSVQDRVQQIGALIGGGRYDPCPDLASRLRDARSDAERRELMDRQRRACGRQRGLP